MMEQPVMQQPGPGMVPQPAEKFNDPAMEAAYQQWKMEKMVADAKAESEIKIRASGQSQLPSY